MQASDFPAVFSANAQNLHDSNDYPIVQSLQHLRDARSNVLRGVFVVLAIVVVSNCYYQPVVGFKSQLEPGRLIELNVVVGGSTTVPSTSEAGMDVLCSRPAAIQGRLMPYSWIARPRRSSRPLVGSWPAIKRHSMAPESGR
nr:hypothetical protein [Burkholderia ambifaria]